MRRRARQLFSKFIPAPPEDIESGAALDKNYKTFSRGLLVLLTVLVLLPSLIISVLSHYQYQKLLHYDELSTFTEHLDQSRDQVDQFFSERRSLVKFISNSNRYQQLTAPGRLEELLERLKDDYPEISDLEIIDGHGMVAAQAGPNSQQGAVYTEQPWYRNTIRQDETIAFFLAGNSNPSYFGITISRAEKQSNTSWMIRARISDAGVRRIIETTGTALFDDIFIVNEKSKVLTAPFKYGVIGQGNPLANMEEVSDSILVELLSEQAETFDNDGQITVRQPNSGLQIVEASFGLPDTPFRLIMAKEMNKLSKAQFSIRIKLIAIFVTCTIVAIFIILEISKGITRHIKESDKKRQLFLAEVEHSNKLASIGRLAAGVAHEINNPLSIINQKAGLVQDFIEMSEEFTHRKTIMDTLDGIQDSVLRCKTITHRLLGFARQEDVHTELLDINVILREVIDFLAKEATYAQIRIDFDLDETVPTILCDRTQLQQIFLNITSNAIDAIGSNGRIILATSQIDDDNIMVSITDDGPGISEEVKKHIFDPFFTTKETGKGTGLGLSITYGLIQKLGGEIDVISEVGKGTTFEITLSII